MTTPRLCNYTKSDGQLCRAFAMGRSPPCFAHKRDASRAHRRTLALNRGRTVRLGPLDTRPAIQSALNRVIQSLASEGLPLHRAGRYLYRIRLALTAITRAEAAQLALSAPQFAMSAPQFAMSLPGLFDVACALDPPPSLCLGGLDLLSLIHPPTINQTPAPRRPPQPAVNHHPHTRAVNKESYTKDDHFPDS